MVVYQLECVECGESRVGRDTDDGIQPVQDACPECGTSKYDIPARE